MQLKNINININLNRQAILELKLRPHDRLVRLRTTIAEKLPSVTDFSDEVKIHIRDHNIVRVSCTFGNNLSARITEITLTIKFADAPRIFNSRTVDRSHKILIRHGVGGLLQLPQIFAQPGNRR